jgi:hypothetical protein
VNRLHVPETAVRIPGTYLVSKAVDEVKYRDPPRANADELFAVHLVKETLESDALEYCRLRVPPCTLLMGLVAEQSDTLTSVSDASTSP